MIDKKVLKGIGFRLLNEGPEVSTWIFNDIEVNLSESKVEIQIENVHIMGVEDEADLLKLIELVYND